jgi:hypothetical protein
VVETAESAEAAETAEAAEIELGCYSEESIALASNVEARCVPFSIEWYFFWHLPVQSPLHL